MPSKAERITQFDYIRVIALFGILLCHSCFDIGGDGQWFGKYLACTFNFLFLILSAFLLGSGWKKTNCRALDKNFLAKRIGKLSKTYYPFLVFLFLILYLSDGYFSLLKMVNHFLYLPWFDTISGYGHLWFLTLIVICYFAVYFYSKTPFLHRNVAMTVGFIIASIALDYIVTRNGLPGFIFPYVVC